jgi:hypothetical protein
MPCRIAAFDHPLSHLFSFVRGDKGGEGFNLICMGAPRVHRVTSRHKSRFMRHADDV